MKHPLPWRAQRAWRNFADFSYPAWVVIDADGRDVHHWQINADYPEPIAQEMAERVVRAVNCHTDLLAACELGLRIAEIAVENGLCFDEQTNQQILNDHVDLKTIRAAISRAKGGA